jgi:phage shock protein PspC (stress-responsive transcriptional regulator)
MKKTTQIHIAGSLFYIEENAYAILDGYLDSIKKHFEDNPDKDEILSDIESRIAEKLTEEGVKIITTKHVEDIIASIGTIEELGGEEAEKKSESTSASSSRKHLYRDTDSAIVGGVAAGLGHYFGVDPLIIRIIFIVFTFGGGSGILLYIVLWFAIPAATTTAQKLEMRGDKVTLSNVSEMIKEKVKEVKSRNGIKDDGTESRGFRAILENIVSFIKKGIIPVFRILFGWIFANVSFILGVAITAFVAIAIFNASFLGIDPVLVSLTHNGF